VATRHRTVLDLRTTNRSAVLRALFVSGPASRVQLARSTGLSNGTITNVITDLMGDGLVDEAGPDEPTGGRPSVKLRVNPAYGLFLGVDVGETGIRVEGFDFAMAKVAGTMRPLGSVHGPKVVVDSIASGLDEVISQLGGAGEIVGLGLGVPGVVSQNGEPIVLAPAFGWHSVPLVTLLRPHTDLPIVIENGAKTMGQAEMWFGAGRGARHAIVVLLGTGVGAAIFADGVLYRGAASSAGEWGHTTIVHDGHLCRCGSRGCLEAYVGADAVLRRWAERGGRQARLGADEEDDLLALVEAGAEGREAQQVINEIAGYLATGICSLVNLFDPERIVIGGWAGMLLGPSIIEAVRAHVAEHSVHRQAMHADIQLSQLGPDAVALGAATLVADRLLARGGERPRRGQSRGHVTGPM
jgi:predicted NBD/HSP70 family sugar kinase